MTFRSIVFIIAVGLPVFPASAESGDLRKPTGQGTDEVTNSEKQKGDNRMGANAFGLRDDQFWQEPLTTFSQTGKRLKDDGFEGIVIAGPSEIPTDTRDRFPVISLRVVPSEEASRFPFSSHAYVCAVELSSGLVYTGPAATRQFAKPRKDPNAPPPPPGLRSDGNVADLFTTASVPNGVGRYAIRTIVWERASEPIFIDAGPSSLLENESAFNERLVKRRKETIARWYSELKTDNLLLDKQNESPSTPSEPGLAISCQAEWNATERKPLQLYGSFALPLSDLFAAEKTTEEEEVPFRGVLPIALLAISSDGGMVGMRTIIVPLPASQQDSEHTEGWFSLDLSTIMELPATDQDLVLFALSGVHLSSPVFVGING